MLGMNASSCDEDSLIVARIDGASIDVALALENRMRDEAARHNSRYSRIAAAALHNPASRRGANPTGERD